MISTISLLLSLQHYLALSKLSVNTYLVENTSETQSLYLTDKKILIFPAFSNSGQWTYWKKVSGMKQNQLKVWKKCSKY